MSSRHLRVYYVVLSPIPPRATDALVRMRLGEGVRLPPKQPNPEAGDQSLLTY